MTQEDKELLLKDLCARLPYGVIFKDECDENLQEIHYIRDEEIYTRTYPHLPYSIETIKPYLRLMSDMTEEERKEYKHLVAFSGSPNGAANFVDWLNSHHFDYRGLIQMGLAIEATKGMYNIKKK